MYSPDVQRQILLAQIVFKIVEQFLNSSARAGFSKREISLGPDLVRVLVCQFVQSPFFRSFVDLEFIPLVLFAVFVNDFAIV